MPAPTLAARALGLVAIASGVIDVVWGQFEPVHQPLQAWGEHVPGARVFAYVIALLLLAGGAMLQRRQSTQMGAAAVGAVYVVFAIFWLPRIVTAPHYLGPSPAVYLGVLSGVFQQLVVVAAALFLCSRAQGAARWIFALAVIDFGLVHLTGIRESSIYVPRWMPAGQDFWVVFTGIAFILAGIAFIVRVQDVLAARLLAIMFLTFNFLSLGKSLVLAPHDQIAWGANAYNLMAAISAWILAEYLAARRTRASGSRVPAAA